MTLSSKSLPICAMPGLLPVRPGNVDLVLSRVDAVFDKLVARYEEQLAPAIPQIWSNRDRESSQRSARVGPPDRCGRLDLATALRRARVRSWRGGDQYRDAASRPGPVEILNGIKLRGSIDLVERHASGHRFRVTDHKTGRVAKDGRDNRIRTGSFVTGGGKILQPLLYALAAEQLLAALEGTASPDPDDDGVAAGEGAPGSVMVESGRLFYCTQRGGYEVAEVRLNDSARRDVSEILDAIDRSLCEGFLPAMPGRGECSWCDYAAICGPYEETRTRRKKREALVHLEKVRKVR